MEVIIKTSLLEIYVNYTDRSLGEHAIFVDTTTRQSTYFKIIIVFNTIIVSLFLIYLMF